MELIVLFICIFIKEIHGQIVNEKLDKTSTFKPSI